MIDIIVGGKYKVDAANSSGWYEVLKLDTDDQGNILSVTCKGQEAFSRIFKPEQLIKQRAVKNPRVTGKVLQKVGELKGHDVHDFEIESWPNEKKRGRPRKLND